MRNVSFVKKKTARGFAVARRSYMPRCIGLSVGFVAVYFALPEHQTSAQAIALLVAYCFGWPHLAIVRALFSEAPAKTERANLLFDAPCKRPVFTLSFGPIVRAIER
jgi:diguanylate cyclase